MTMVICDNTNCRFAVPVEPGGWRLCQRIAVSLDDEGTCIDYEQE